LTDLAFPTLSGVLERRAAVSTAGSTLPSRKRALTEDLTTPSRKRQQVEHFPVDLTRLSETLLQLNEWGEYV